MRGPVLAEEPSRWEPPVQGSPRSLKYQTSKPSRVGPENTPLQSFPGRSRAPEGEHVTVNRHMNRLKGVLGWSLASITLAYVLVAAAAGAIAP